jgi:hypothetical protein
MQQKQIPSLETLIEDMGVSKGDDGKYYCEASTLFGNLFDNTSWQETFKIVVNGATVLISIGAPERDREGELKWYNYSGHNIHFVVFND